METIAEYRANSKKVIIVAPTVSYKENKVDRMNLLLDVVYQFIFFIDDIETLENFLTTNSIVGYSFL